MQVIAAVTCQMLILYFWHFQNFILRLCSVTRPQQQPSLNLTGLTVQHETTVVEPGPKASLYFSYTRHLLRCPNFAAIKWGGKKHCRGWQFHWTEMLCFNAKSKAADPFFAWFRKLRGFKSNKVKLGWLSKCQMLPHLSNLQQKCPFLLWF